MQVQELLRWDTGKPEYATSQVRPAGKKQPSSSSTWSLAAETHCTNPLSFKLPEFKFGPKFHLLALVLDPFIVGQFQHGQEA